MKHYYCLIAAAVMVAINAGAQTRTAWFIDGYHGGVYGHYPPGYTAFLVEQLQKHPDWKINLEIEPETWDVARAYEPEAYGAFKKLMEVDATAPRIEVVNPSYGQSYLFQASGESVIRQFDYGFRKLRQHFPSIRFTTYSSEEPCFTSCLPSVLKSFGFEFAALKNPNTCWGGYTSAHGGELVNWIGPDGTSLPAVPRYRCEALDPKEPWRTLASGNSPEYVEACFAQGIQHPVGMCLQDAGWRGGPWLQWSAKNHYQPSKYILWSDYVRNITSGKTDEDWKFSQEDVKPGLMWGAQVLQRLAQQSREAEHRLLVAEKIAAVARIDAGRPARIEAFDEAWHGILLSQHHDCWIVPYNGRLGNTWADQVRRWTRAANSTSDLARENALEALLHNEDRQRGRVARLINPTGNKLDQVVPVPIPKSDNASVWTSRDAEGHEFLTQVVDSEVPGQSQLLVRATLPPMGYTTVELRNGRPIEPNRVRTESTADSVVIESDLYRIQFDPARGGTIRSLIAKTQGSREYVDTKSDRLFNELRGNFYAQGGFHSSADNPAKVTLAENGPLRAAVTVSGTIADNTFTQRVSITQGSPVIDCSLHIDWQSNPGIGEFEETNGWGNFRRAAYDDRFKLLTLFPTPLDQPSLTKDAPFDVCESTLEDSFYNSWDQIKHNIVLDWVDVASKSGSQGLALFSDHTTSYTFGSNFPLGLTIQYAGKGLWARDYRVEGPTQVRYALVPHAGRWNTANLPALSASWQEPAIGALASGGPARSRSLINPGDSGWLVPAMFERNDSIFVRLFNANGDSSPRKLQLGFDADLVELVELDGRVIRKLPVRDDHSVELDIPHLGFRTLRFSEVHPPQGIQR
jgi:alpha-mannosidase